ncbi:hypothetical protein D9M71_738870 [compost metagenome]
MSDEFGKWQDDYASGTETPTEREINFWKDNNKRGQGLINRGFLDSKMTPNRNAYTTAKSIAQTMYLLKEKLKITDEAPKFTYASIRCYKDWSSYVKQMVLSFS